jgi:hypothetical protein
MIVCPQRFMMYLTTAKDFKDLILMMFYNMQMLLQRVISNHILTNGLLEKCFHIILIYLLTAIGLSPGGSSTVYIYTTTIHNTIYTTTIHNTTNKFGWKAFWDSGPEWSN